MYLIYSTKLLLFFNIILSALIHLSHHKFKSGFCIDNHS